MAPEWFCGCKHNGRSPGGGANDTKEAKNHKNKVSPSSVRAFLRPLADLQVPHFFQGEEGREGEQQGHQRWKQSQLQPALQRPRARHGRRPVGPGPDSGLPVDARPEAGVGDGAGVQDPLEAVRSMRDVQGGSETTMCLSTIFIILTLTLFSGFPSSDALIKCECLFA